MSSVHTQTTDVLTGHNWATVCRGVSGRTDAEVAELACLLTLAAGAVPVEHPASITAARAMQGAADRASVPVMGRRRSFKRNLQQEDAYRGRTIAP